MKHFCKIIIIEHLTKENHFNGKDLPSEAADNSKFQDSVAEITRIGIARDSHNVTKEFSYNSWYTMVVEDLFDEAWHSIKTHYID